MTSDFIKTLFDEMKLQSCNKTILVGEMQEKVT